MTETLRYFSTTFKPPASAVRPGARQVFDVDIATDGRIVFAMGGKRAEYLVSDDGQVCDIPDAMLGYIMSARWFGRDEFLLVGRRALSADECNAVVIGSDGKVHRRFPVGDGVIDVFRTESFLVVTYFDEGVVGSTPQGQEGVAVFDLEGSMLWGWNGTIAPMGPSPIIDLLFRSSPRKRPDRGLQLR